MSVQLNRIYKCWSFFNIIFIIICTLSKINIVKITWIDIWKVLDKIRSYQVFHLLSDKKLHTLKDIIIKLLL